MELVRELQKILELVVSLLLEGVARTATPFVILSGDETAATDGKASVFMPKTFLGQPIAQQMANAIGLLAHEIGHWLQPLDEIQEVEKATGLNHDIANVFLDIQLETNVIRITPLFKNNLRNLRSDVGDANRKDYEKGRKSSDFLENAFCSLLYGRFCINLDFSFSPGNSNNHKVQSLLNDATEFISCKSRDLPNLLRKIAGKYPDRCDKRERNRSGRKLLNPTDMVLSGNVGNLVQLIEASLVVYDGPDTSGNCTGALGGKVNPAADVLAASRLIQKRWEVPRSGGSLMGPGRMNRLATVRGDPVPFDVPAPKGRSLPETKVVLVADYSTSMQGAAWTETVRAAQAITLAIQNTGGEVKGAIFEGYLIHTKDFSADIFFSRSIGGNSLDDAHGHSTSFGWLPLVWQSFPQHRVVILTDGNGCYPPLVPQAARKRTSVILLRIGSGSRPHAEATVRKFAERFVHVENLNEIASAWSVVIPRLAQ